MSNPDDLFSVEPTDDPMRYRAAVTEPMLIGPNDKPFAIGGVRLAVAVDALERAAQRPLVWVTGQFVSYANVGDLMEFVVDLAVEGRRATQASVRGYVGDRLFLQGLAALGNTPSEPTIQLATAPVVPPPADCPLEPHQDRDHGRFHSLYERRRIPVNVPNGGAGAEAPGIERTLTWRRFHGTPPVTSALLTVIADLLPGEMRVALGRDKQSRSLENTVRIVQLEPTEWFLCEAHTLGLVDGFFHQTMRIYSEAGTLLAYTSQSGPITLL